MTKNSFVAEVTFKAPLTSKEHCHPNFMTCLHCLKYLQLHPLSTTAIIYEQRKLIQTRTKKTAWSSTILEWHLFLRLSLGFGRKILIFVGKHLSFPQKYLFIFCIFYLNKEELIQQICLIKSIEIEIPNSTS